MAQDAFSENPQQDAAYSAMWRAVLDFENPTNSRPQLLAEFEAIVTNYPDSKYQQRAKDTVAILARMIAEDVAHAKKATTNLDRLPEEDRVRELIFQLRDQNGYQWSQPGECDIFRDKRGTNSPASQLVNIGYPAVPQLIKALEDDTFSRSIGFGRNFFFSHTVLTVGDCAVTILQRIAGRSFYQPASTSGYMSNEHTNAATRKIVEAWWAEFQKKGEKQVLIEGTDAGNDDSPAQAEMLVDRYSELALTHLIKGFQVASNEWVRAQLVQLVDKFSSQEALTFLDRVMREGRDSASVGAAEILTRKGRTGVIPIMIRKWLQSPDDDGDGALGGFLANADSPEAIDALGESLMACSVNHRMDVVCCVGESGTWAGGFPTNRSKATMKSVERLLIGALQDEGQKMGESGIRMNKRYVDPRVCDMAGLFLNLRWPERYPFDLEAPLKTRDIQRIQCQNIWRLTHQLPLLPLPVASSNLVSRIEATKVMKVEWLAGKIKPTGAFASRVAELNGKILNGTNIVDLLLAFAMHPEPGASGFTFQARKDDDLSGVRIRFGLLSGVPPSDKDDWRFSQDCTVGTAAIDCTAGGIFATERRCWDDLLRDFKSAIAAAPETPFVINVRLESHD